VQNPEKWLFLDTETTGLAAARARTRFLVGLAWWDAGGLQVEQLFMRDFSEEHSLHGIVGAFGGTPRAGHVQWEIVRIGRCLKIVSR